MALISEPERLEDYATHCFATLNEYGIKPDESKGKKPENLRYLSYDCNMLYRENPEPLIIQVKQPPQANKKTHLTNTAHNCLKLKEATETAHRLLNNIKRLESGGRTKGIQKYAYTLGGLGDGDMDLLEAIKKIIKTGDNFSDKEEFLLKCADDCFTAGGLKPII